MCRGGLEKHPSHGLARWSLRGPPRTHIHTHRPHRTRPFVCAQAPARSAPSARSLATQGAHATRDRRAARAHWPRAPQPEPGRGAGGLRWPPEGHGAEAQAFTCAGQGPRGGEGQERRQQPHPVQEQRRFQAGGRAQRRPPGMPRAGGTGFYSGAATGGSPYSGARVPAPPPGGASPPASCP